MAVALMELYGVVTCIRFCFREVGALVLKPETKKGCRLKSYASWVIPSIQALWFNRVMFILRVPDLLLIDSEIILYFISLAVRWAGLRWF